MTKNKKLTNLSFEDKELFILRNAVDNAEKKLGTKIKLSNNIESIITILELFLRRKKTICYGGTAINNILPESDQFYNKDIEIPDYDFYSSNAQNHAVELADIYASHGYNDIEVRSGMHVGTYKVFVNFIPIADITQMESTIFNVLYKQTIRKNGISYCPPNYLRLHIYNELSRPDGDVSRWEKIYKRLVLLNKHYPMKINPKCSQLDFMRDFTGTKETNNQLYDIVKNTMIREGCVFIGGYATSLYGRYMSSNEKKQLLHVPDFDVLSIDPKSIAYILKENLQQHGFNNIQIIKKSPVHDDIILTHYEIVVDKDTICFIYQPYGCYSYNKIKIKNETINVATIETMLLFMLSFIYSGRPYYDHDRLMCMAEYLLNVQSKNRLEQKGLLKRFNINCYGNEKTIIQLRSDKAEKYEELRNNKNSSEYKKYFFKYIPNKKQFSNKKKINKNNSKNNSKNNNKNNNKKYTYKNNNKHTKTRKNIIKNVINDYF